MGVVQNIIGMVRDIKDRDRTSKINEQLKNYLNNPEATIAAINQIDAPTGLALNDKHISEQSARQAAARTSGSADLGAVRNVMRGLPPGSDYGTAFDNMAPAFASLGVSPERLASFKTATAANPGILMDDNAFEAWTKDQHSNTVAPIGSHVIRGGQVIDRVPFAPKTVTTQAGATTNVFDPNANEGTGGFTTGAGGPLTLERLRPLVVAQESSGDYTAVNSETGALGRYQVMPDTGKVLAQRAGLPWRPDMMRKDDQASRNYQDKIGNAAIQESIDFSGGDPSKLFSHYYGGPDRKRWGPKTRQYTSEMMDRLGGGRGNGAGLAGSSPTSVSVPAKPTVAGKTYSTLTPAEVAAAGLPVGTVAQRGSDGKVSVIDKVPAAARPKPYDYEKARTSADKLDLFVTATDDLLKDTGLDSAVGIVQGRLPGFMLGQRGQTWRNKLEGLKSNIGLSQLMEAKAGSSQGASGFGNLSNEEGRRLERAFGTLETSSDEGTIRENLKSIADVSRRANERIRWQMERADAGLPYRVPAAGTERGGYKFLGGSPEVQANWIKTRQGDAR